MLHQESALEKQYFKGKTGKESETPSQSPSPTMDTKLDQKPVKGITPFFFSFSQFLASRFSEFSLFSGGGVGKDPLTDAKDEIKTLKKSLREVSPSQSSLFYSPPPPAQR